MLLQQSRSIIATKRRSARIPTGCIGLDRNGCTHQGDTPHRLELTHRRMDNSATWVQMTLSCFLFSIFAHRIVSIPHGVRLWWLQPDRTLRVRSHSQPTRQACEDAGQSRARHRDPPAGGQRSAARRGKNSVPEVAKTGPAWGERLVQRQGLQPTATLANIPREMPDGSADERRKNRNTPAAASRQMAARTAYTHSGRGRCSQPKLPQKPAKVNSEYSPYLLSISSAGSSPVCARGANLCQRSCKGATTRSSPKRADREKSPLRNRFVAVSASARENSPCWLTNSLSGLLSLSIEDPMAMATFTRVVVRATVRLMATDCHWLSAINSTWLNPAASRRVSRPDVGRSSGLRT